MKLFNMQYKHLSLSYCLILFNIVALYGQQPKLVEVVPPSPNTASLGKYGEIPVSLYTGIPSISIPLYEIKDKDISLSLSLSYHAGGVKVEEIPSAVGLGWTLNAGGVVGRSVRGLADEFGWQPQPSNNTIEGIIASGNVTQLIKDVADGYRDGEADIYYYNFDGFSGKFFYDQSGNIHTYPQKNILITPISGGGWKIVTENGNVYSFTKQEDISSSNCGDDQIVPTAWYLSSIKSSDTKREIVFTYEYVWIVSQTLLSQTKYFAYNGESNCLPQPSPCQGTNQSRTHRLTRIDFADGYLKFVYNNVRCDLVDDKSLDFIEVYNKSGALFKKWELKYNYFGDNSDGVNRNTENNKRLKLLSVTEQGTSTVNPPYLFEYEESITLPHRLSFAQDHWGYFNGKNNADLIPTFNNGQAVIKGADRRADPDKTQADILKKIKYPTGGETVFTYENNTVSDDRVEYNYTEQSILLTSPGYKVSDLPSPYESGILTIPSEGAAVHFNISGLDSWPWQSCDIVQCQVIKDNNYSAPFRILQNSLDGGVENWPAGNYKLKLVTECGLDATANFSAMVTAQIMTPESFSIRTVGGLRIKEIEDKPLNGGQSIIKKYRYHPDNDPEHSSGVLINFPDYKSFLVVHNGHTFYGDPGQPGETVWGPDCNYIVCNSYSNYPLATTQGSYVGYSHVIEDLGANGEIRHTFIAYENVVGGAFPFPPAESFDWRRGFELKTQYYSVKNGELILLKELTNTPYSFYSFDITGIKAARDELFLVDGNELINLRPIPKYGVYQTITEFSALVTQTERSYDPNDISKFVEKKVNYIYGTQHLQPIQIATSTSKSSQTIADEIITNNKYVFDYNFSGSPSGAAALAIKKLQDLHVANAIIEKYSIRQNRNISNNQLSNQRVVGSIINLYKPDNPYIDQILRLETNSPIPLSNFGTGSLVSNNAFVYNSNSSIASSYKANLLFDKYDVYGNIVQQHKSDDINEVYLWGYNAQYPVAKIVGSDYATAIALVNQTLLNNVNGQFTDVQMRTELNNLRTGLPSAQVWTYTYTPLIGMTSETDPKGYISFYEYDDFGRLLDVKDADGNIIKTFEYHYEQ